MGGQSSKEERVLIKRFENNKMKLIQRHFSEFLEKQMELDPNGYVMYNDVIAHFYTYLYSQKILISMHELTKMFFNLVKNTLTNQYDPLIVHPEGISIVKTQGHTYYATLYNYSYIHGLKLSRSVYSTGTSI